MRSILVHRRRRRSRRNWAAEALERCTRFHVRARRPSARHPPARSPPVPSLRPCPRVPRACGRATARSVRRRPPMGRRGQPPLLRYVVRTDGTSPIFLAFAIRPEESAHDRGRDPRRRHGPDGPDAAAQGGSLLARRDPRVPPPAPERAGRRGERSPMHAQAEGVPFILEELARAYRDAGMIQQIDGVVAPRDATPSGSCRRPCRP